MDQEEGWPSGGSAPGSDPRLLPGGNTEPAGLVPNRARQGRRGAYSQTASFGILNELCHRGWLLLTQRGSRIRSTDGCGMVKARRLAREEKAAPLPGFIEDIGPVCRRQLDQSSIIDPAVDRSAGGTDVEEQVPAGRVGAENR